MEFSCIQTNGITLHVGTAGKQDGPLAVLLHGFPELWYSWREQIDTLVEQGYRVVVPDQRGYNKSDKPLGEQAYVLDQLRDDVIGLIESFGHEKAVVIGHDWGGVVAWHLAGTRSEWVEKLVILNSPHPAVLKDTMKRKPVQFLKSLYVFFFQIPKLPEWLLQKNQFKRLKKALLSTSRPYAFTEKDLELYEEAWSRPGSLTAMINWYRALKAKQKQEDSPVITVPVQIIWGIQDTFLSLAIAEENEKQCSNVSTVLVDATHWVHIEQPKLVNNHMTTFLKGKNTVLNT
ncbi:alpha/beta fold hydrolase [Jeotgalibacillus campisalis]|uniref:Alpha\beta hydrolase n=1 Tax=Jeotgalibacillus campisalis TaxID=220754 RepID=A0A0C2VIC4_9BACL|nr:alpha/beta hydrolase [Jeotgalibacillus campisalis]KIL43758.1 alpha\beta hydrolase [Jeotgalibacillus campisalis]